MKISSIDSKLKILICENDTRILVRLESWINAMDNEAKISGDGFKALDIYTEMKPDIVIVSQELKGIGGIELIEKIKHINPNQAIILMLSAEADSDIFKRSIDLQIDKYLNVPVDASRLYSAVEALAQEKLFYKEFQTQKRLLQDYKDAIDISFSVTKHDKDGKIFYANESFCKTINLSLEEAVKGKINPLDNPSIDMEAVWNELHENGIYIGRQEFKFNDGNEHILDITAVSMYDESDVAIEYLVFTKDVSEVVYSARKIREQEIEKRIQKLEHAKEINRVKDSFLTVFTHELKTPLNAIINFSDYVKKHLLKEEFKKRDRLVDQVTQINSSGWKMLDMIINLIEAMKLRDSKIDLNIFEFSLNATLENSLQKYINDTYDIKIIKSYEKDCIINSDERRVSQIVDNVLTNAIKYCNRTILIALKSDENSFSIEISDDGEGFTNTEEAFHLFEQLSNDDMTRSAQGTGVGLFVVNKLCSAMNYKLNVIKSEELGGAKVIVRGEKDINR